MPTYLVHGFRWQRAGIRIHIILQDLEDAAAEWIVAPATSVTLLNSFYKLYDFLPACHPPPPTYPPPPPIPQSFPPPPPIPQSFPPPPPIPPDDVYGPDENSPPRKSLSKKNTRSMVSLRSLARKNKPANLAPIPNNSQQERPPTAPRPQTARHPPPAPTASRPQTARYPPPSRHSNSLRPQKGPSFNDWSAVKLLEQYDPTDMYSTSQPYAYVADYMVEVTLGASLTDEMSKYEAQLRNDDVPDTPVSEEAPDMNGLNGAGDATILTNGRGLGRKTGQPGWFEKLRDGLQNGCDIGWYVVVCGDEERAPPPTEETLQYKFNGRPSITSDGSSSLKMPRSGGFKALFRKKVVAEG